MCAAGNYSKCLIAPIYFQYGVIIQIHSLTIFVALSVSTFLYVFAT